MLQCPAPLAAIHLLAVAVRILVPNFIDVYVDYNTVTIKYYFQVLDENGIDVSSIVCNYIIIRCIWLYF